MFRWTCTLPLADPGLTRRAGHRTSTFTCHMSILQTKPSGIHFICCIITVTLFSFSPVSEKSWLQWSWIDTRTTCFSTCSTRTLGTFCNWQRLQNCKNKSIIGVSSSSRATMWFFLLSKFVKWFQVHKRLAISPRRPGMDNAGARYGSFGEDQHLWKGDLLLLRRTKLEVSVFTDSMTYLDFSPWNFQITNFRKVSKEFHLDYDKLEDRPSLPQQNGAATAGNAPGNSTAGTGASSATNGPPLPNAPPQPQPTGPSPVMQFGGGGSGPGMTGFVTYVDLVSPTRPYSPQTYHFSTRGTGRWEATQSRYTGPRRQPSILKIVLVPFAHLPIDQEMPADLDHRWDCVINRATSFWVQTTAFIPLDNTREEQEAYEEEKTWLRQC